MSDPTHGGKKKPPMSEEDSLAVEAYGTQGAAMRKAAAKLAEGEQKSESAPHSFIQGILKHFQ
jgi:hypothetical protein